MVVVEAWEASGRMPNAGAECRDGVVIWSVSHARRWSGVGCTGGLLRRAAALALGRGPVERVRVCTLEAELLGRQPQTKQCLQCPPQAQDDSGGSFEHPRWSASHFPAPPALEALPGAPRWVILAQRQHPPAPLAGSEPEAQ